MAYKVLPNATYTALIDDCDAAGFDYFLFAGLIDVESARTWNPNLETPDPDWAHIAYGLCQLHVDAAKDAGWLGSNPGDLKNPILNIDLGVKYLKLCKDYVINYCGSLIQQLDPINKQPYGANMGALSAYNQGRQGFYNNGWINLDSYVRVVQRAEDNIRQLDLCSDDGRCLLGTPAAPPDTKPTVDVLKEVYVWLDSLKNNLKKDKTARPWPELAQYQTTMGQTLYRLYVLTFAAWTAFDEWLSTIETYTPPGG